MSTLLHHHFFPYFNILLLGSPLHLWHPLLLLSHFNSLELFSVAQCVKEKKDFVG